MGQKCNSNALRLGLNKNWLCRWNSPDRPTTIKWILEDEKIRNLFNAKCKEAGVGLIEIERFINLKSKLTFVGILHLIQPALFTNNEKEYEELIKLIQKIVGKDVEVKVNIFALKNPGVSANVLAHEVAMALESRSPFRLTLKRTIKKAMNAGAKGIRIKVTGRINGVEMSRSESYSEGAIPLSTLRADIEYCFHIAQTTYGVLGVKVWVNRGLYFGKYFMPLPEEVKLVKNFSKNKFISRSY